MSFGQAASSLPILTRVVVLFARRLVRSWLSHPPNGDTASVPSILLIILSLRLVFTSGHPWGQLNGTESQELESEPAQRHTKRFYFFSRSYLEIRENFCETWRNNSPEGRFETSNSVTFLFYSFPFGLLNH